MIFWTQQPTGPFGGDLGLALRFTYVNLLPCVDILIVTSQLFSILQGIYDIG